MLEIEKAHIITTVNFTEKFSQYCVSFVQARSILLNVCLQFVGNILHSKLYTNKPETYVDLIVKKSEVKTLYICCTDLSFFLLIQYSFDAHFMLLLLFFLVNWFYLL